MPYPLGFVLNISYPGKLPCLNKSTVDLPVICFHCFSSAFTPILIIQLHCCFIYFFNYYYFFIFWLRCTATQHMGSQFLNQASNLCPLHWQRSLNSWTTMEVPYVVPLIFCIIGISISYEI
ncbi:unnamed protein product [Rangifer tarandus platyrhynchus]|uniref:Uncharacterized protein n=1 Tax=Rangifer tarandus platyrhynchus TaxID=3082113 RepID=A0AC59ZZ84_RANTA